MAKEKIYHLNPETLLYEVVKRPLRVRFRKGFLMFLASLAMFVLYFWLYSSVLNLDSPKMLLLKGQNAFWRSRVELLDRRMDIYDAALNDLEIRNRDIYRSIFGMNEIPQDVAGVGRAVINNPEVATLPANSTLRNAYLRMDRLTRMAYIQSKSYDEVSSLSKRAGEMASCIPAIAPILPDKNKYKISSTFGYRSDPVHGQTRMHEGIDFSMKTGNPVYATGDGVVESASFLYHGYGNMIIIDHGFGYKTRYAHLSKMNVVEGMKVKRGELIGESGNSGKSTGAHLHYEVLYRGRPVNPVNFFDLDIPLKEYKEMLVKTESESHANERPKFVPKKR